MSKCSAWVLILPACLSCLGCEAIATFDPDRIGTMTAPPTVLPPLPPGIDAGRADGGVDPDAGDADAMIDPDAQIEDASEDAEADAAEMTDAAAPPVDAGVLEDASSETQTMVDAGMDAGVDAGSDMDASGLDAGLDAQATDAALDADAGAATLDASDAHLDATSDAADAQDADGSS